MTIRRIKHAIVGVAAFHCGAALGAEITLTELLPKQRSAGDIIEMSVTLDFSDEPTSGGCVDFEFDPDALEVWGFTFESIPSVDVSHPSAYTGAVRGWCVEAQDGIEGELLLGTVRFRLAQTMCGSTLIDVVEGAEHWQTAVGSQPIEVTYNSPIQDR